MSSSETDFGESFATTIVKWICFAGLLIVLAFGILFGIFVVNQPQKSPIKPVRKRSSSDFDKIKIWNLDNPAENADHEFQIQNWEESARLYSELFKQFPDNYDALYRKGLSLQYAGKLDQALEVYNFAKTLKNDDIDTLYNIAVIYSKKKNKSQVLLNLQLAILAGYMSLDVPLSQKEPFAFLKGNPEFDILEQRALPLNKRTIYRQFDFILGSWQLFDRNDQPLTSHRVVSKENNGYLLTVIMTQKNGNRATGFNFVDPEDLKWKQIWAQGKGTALKYEGEFRDGKMQFTGKEVDEKGNVVLRRKVYIPVGHNKIEHVIEKSTNGGKSWMKIFDGYWLRITEKPAKK